MAALIDQENQPRHTGQTFKQIRFDIVCQVSKDSTASLVQDLGEHMASWLAGLETTLGYTGNKSIIRVQAMRNLSASLFAQCMRQEGLIQVFRTLLSAKKSSFTIKYFPNLEGYTWEEVRQAVPGNVTVCGLIRGKTYDFFPADNLVLHAQDR
jgi:Trk K+ transport system NAD-binding subunit